MPPFVYQINSGPRAEIPTSTSVCKPNMSYLPTYNEMGGRPDERRGTKGSFTPGIRVVAGGPARDVPLEAEINPGTVLYIYPELKPDMSGEARTNVVRPTERFGSHGSFTPGTRSIWLGGSPRDVPLEQEINPGTILHSHPHLKPDLSGEARRNAVRPNERWGTKGSFTPGVRTMSGGSARDVPLEALIDPGTVLFTFCELRPDLSGEARTNERGGRPTERWGSRGMFSPGARCWRGGKPRDVPLEAEINPGTVLVTYPELKPDMSGEAHTNAVRPTERLGTQGSFTPGENRHWRGGAPRDVPRERELDHGMVLFSASFEAGVPQQQGDEADDSDGFLYLSDCVEGGEEVQEEAHQMKQVPGEDEGIFGNSATYSNPDEAERATATGGDGGVFRRCGSDSKFPAAGPDLLSGNFPSF